MLGRVGVLVAVTAVAFAAACGPGRNTAHDAGVMGDGPEHDAGPRLTYCGGGPYPGMDAGVIINGAVYCVDGAGTMCCSLYDEGGFGVACLPNITECPFLNLCPYRPPDFQMVCLPDQWCLDDGTRYAGCAQDCAAPQEPCGGTACCTENAYCLPSYGCFPRQDGGQIDAAPCLPPDEQCADRCCPEGSQCALISGIIVCVPTIDAGTDATPADSLSEAGPD
jgi:hypothetical protein